MICWYCYWGWPKQVMDIYQEAIRRLGGDSDALEFGPGHVVWADENFDTESIQWCLLDGFPDTPFDPIDLETVRWSLEELLKVPEEIRCCEPTSYDGEHPENFPPPAGLEMVRE